MLTKNRLNSPSLLVKNDAYAIPEDSILHFSADNVDHNIRTLDGHNTFHGIGIIAIVTRGCFSPINVRRHDVTNTDIYSVDSIEFKMWLSS